MSDPITRAAAIRRVKMMRDDTGKWDLSLNDQDALRHAVDAFADVDTLRARVAELERECEIAGQAADTARATMARDTERIGELKALVAELASVSTDEADEAIVDNESKEKR